MTPEPEGHAPERTPSSIIDAFHAYLDNETIAGRLSQAPAQAAPPGGPRDGQ